MKKRLEDGENFNDQHDTVLRRINTYKETTAPVIEQYAGTIKKVSRIGTLFIMRVSFSPS